MRGFTLFLFVCTLTIASETRASSDDFPVSPLMPPANFTPRTPSSLDAQPDTIFYDNGTPSSYYPQTNYWISARFTPLSSFALHEVYLYLLDGNLSAQSCDVYVYGSNGPVVGQELATVVIPAPLPSLGWAQGNISPAVSFDAGEDFFVVIGPVPGGPQGVNGHKTVLDNGTTTQRSAWTITNNQFGTYQTITHGDWLVRAGGDDFIADTTVVIPPAPYSTIDVVISELNFGGVTPRDSSSMTFWIYNRGYQEDLHIINWGRRPSELHYVYHFNASSLTVPAGDSVEVVATFAPRYALNYDGYLDILNSSDSTTMLTLPLYGYGAPCASSVELVDITGGFPACFCLESCATQLSTVCFVPLSEEERPEHLIILPGCREPEARPDYVSCADGDCPSANPAILEDLFYDSFVGGWCLVIQATDSGCYCVCIDAILPVELISFEAIPGDGEVRLVWRTASETDNDYFDIERDGRTVGQVTADNLASGSSYSWSESGLMNGREYTYSLVSVSVTGGHEIIGTASATPTKDAAATTEYALHQNFPNPFNPHTSITFDLKEGGFVTLNIYNLLGQQVASLVSTHLAAGQHIAAFDAEALTSGVYLCRLEANGFTANRKMVLLK